MESKKINISTFLFIVALIVIAVMGLCIYMLYTEKNTQEQKAGELTTQVSTLNSTVNSLQGKLDKISDALNDTEKEEKKSDVKEDKKTEEKTTKDITAEEIQKALENYLDLYSHDGVANLLNRLTEKGDLNYDSNKDVIQDNTQIVTNVKFDDYKKAMLKYVSEEEFEKNWNALQKNDEGYLYKPQGGGGMRVYTIKEISGTDDKIYTAKCSSVVEDNEYPEENTFTFTVKSNNGKCVIDSFKD